MSGSEWESPIETGPVPNSGEHYEVIVVGGGPGGSAAAAYMAMAGHRVLLLEKAVWPRDKTCGDAVGGKSLKHVEELGIKTTLEKTPHFRVDGIVFSSSNGNEVCIPLPEEEVENREAGYSLPRRQFDTMMFRNATEKVLSGDGNVIQNFTVTEIHQEDMKIIGVSGIVGGKRSGNELLRFSAALTVGAGGYNCPVARMITETHGEPMVDKEHYCGAYREYWTNVGGCDDWKGSLEIHFIDEIIPGYFWIFPVGDGIVNVGIGMVISEMNKRKIKLRGLQEWVITKHPRFSKRFEHSTMIEGSGKGWQLPFGSPRKKPPSYQPRRTAMAGALCIGDAASLVDGFTGEGIGNALYSSKLASDIFDAEKHRDGFTEESAIEYQESLWKQLSPELTNSYKLQRLVKKKWLMNFFIGKASRKVELQRALTDMIASKEAQGQFHSKWWLFKTLLF